MPHFRPNTSTHFRGLQRTTRQPPALARLGPFSAPLSTSSSSTTLTPSPPPRWLAELRARIGKCIIFGCDNQQVSRAAAVLRALALEWRSLLAGSEGFLTGGRRGLDGQRVAWGEMDSFVSFPFLPNLGIHHNRW
jgi:hypothetical protein